MLTEIRDRSTGAFAYFIAALIIVPMAFWGVQEYASTDVVPTILEVGDTKITKQELDQRISQAQEAERQRNPELADSEFFSSDYFKRSILSSMVDRALIEKIATDNEYRVGNEELAGLIRKESLFQTSTGEFDQAAYDGFVQSRLYSKQRFEEQVRNDSRTTQVAQGYQGSAVVMPNEVRLLLELQAERRTFDLVTISEADYRDSISVSDEEVADYYQSNIDSFMNPDLISVEYVELDSSVIAENIVIAEDDLRQQYEDSKDNFISPENRSTRHILLSTTGDKSEADQLATAKSLVEQLRAGGDFAALATEYSDDIASAQDGGSLGQVERGQMVSEFEQATFSLAAGEVSDPVKTQFGYHIIEVTEIAGGVPQAFAEVRFGIEEQMRETEALSEFSDKLLEMRNLVFEAENSLQPVADELGLEIRKTAMFSREEGEGIADNAAVRAAAFDVTVVEDGLNSDPIELAEGRFVALRKVEFKAAAPKELASVSEQIKASLINQGAAAAALAAIESLQTKAMENWSEVVADPALTSNEYTLASIDQELPVANDIVEKVSTMHLEGKTASIDTLRSTNGDFHLIRLSKVEAGDLSQLSDQIKDATRAVLAQRNGNSLFASYMYQLNQKVSKEIDEELL